MDIDALFRQPAFNGLLPEQLQLFRQFARDIHGKGVAEVARMYKQLNAQVSAIKPLSAAQRNGIVEAVRNFLPASERQKLSGLMKLVMR